MFWQLQGEMHFIFEGEYEHYETLGRKMRQGVRTAYKMNTKTSYSDAEVGSQICF